MNLFMAKYEHDGPRLTVGMDDTEYRECCTALGMVYGELRLKLRVGKDALYLSPSANGFKLSIVNAKTGSDCRWRVEFRADSFPAIREVNPFGTSRCHGLIETNGNASSTILRAYMPKDPAPPRPYHPREQRSRRRKTTAKPVKLDPSTKFPATLSIGGQEFALFLTMPEALVLVSQNSG